MSWPAFAAADVVGRGVPEDDEEDDDDEEVHVEEGAASCAVAAAGTTTLLPSPADVQTKGCLLHTLHYVFNKQLDKRLHMQLSECKLLRDF